MLNSSALLVSISLLMQVPAPTTPPALAPEVEVLLDRVERAATELRSFQAGITLAKFDELNEETSFRLGRVAFDGVGTGRRLAARFDKLVVQGASGSQQSSDLDDHFIYENGWLWETDAILKSVKKRQIVPEGSAFDPLKLGEGELPLPIGQAKSSVLENFEPSLCAVPAVATLASLKDVDGLRLVPKPASPLAKEYIEIQVFYGTSGVACANGLAVLQGVHLIHANRNTVSILLRDPKVNASFSSADQALLVTPDLEEKRAAGWAVDVQRLAPKEGAASAATDSEVPGDAPSGTDRRRPDDPAQTKPN